MVKSSAPKSSSASLLDRVNSTSIQLLPTASQRKAQQIKSRAKDTAGPGWFDLPATTRTPEIEKDLRVLSMRSALDRKQFYRGGETPGKSRYFQIGTIQDTATGFYSDRLTRRARPKSLVDSLLKDEANKSYLKKKFNEIQDKYKSGHNHRGRSNGRQSEGRNQRRRK